MNPLYPGDINKPEILSAFKREPRALILKSTINIKSTGVQHVEWDLNKTSKTLKETS